MAVSVMISATSEYVGRTLGLAVGLLLSAFVGPLGAQAVPATAELEAPTSPAPLTSPAPSEVSPALVTPLRTMGRQLSVHVLVNGNGPYLFTLDTGSGMTVCIDAELAKTLALPTVGEVMNSDGSGTVVPRALAGIESFVLGDHEFGAQEALVADYRFVSGTGRDRVMGILGLSLFAGGVVTLDAPREELRWPDGELELGDHTVSYTAPNGIPEIWVGVGERSWRTVVDTGFSGSFALPDSLRDVLELDGRTRVIGESRGPNGTSGQKVRSATLVEPLEFAGHRVAAPDVYFMEGRSEPYLGGTLLRRYALSFDTAKRLLAIRSG